MKSFVLAIRPKTLLAGVVPPLLAYAFYLGQRYDGAAMYMVFCVLGALFIQIATNFFNDVIDHEKGADEKRVGPTRVTASGLMSVKTVKRWAKIFVGLAALCGVPIIIRGGWPFVVLGLISLYLTYGYTGGKVSLAYRGLGELFVFLFFGLFSVMGSYYLYGLSINWQAFALASMMGLMATTFICINNLRDRSTDKEVGKMTMATRMSVNAYRAVTLATVFVPYFLLFFFTQFTALPVVFIALIPAIKLSRIILKAREEELNLGLKFSGIHLVVFSLLLGLIFLYERLLPPV